MASIAHGATTRNQITVELPLWQWAQTAQPFDTHPPLAVRKLMDRFGMPACRARLVAELAGLTLKEATDALS